MSNMARKTSEAIKELLISRFDCPPQYHSHIYFRPVSGLMSRIIPGLRLPMSKHSTQWHDADVGSFTVAGAVLALLKYRVIDNAPASRLTYKINL